MTEAFDLANAPLTDGTVLLEASAGTGKTWTLCGIVLRLLLEKSVDDLTQVLVVTFTIAATEELKTRLRTGLQRAEAACRTGDDPDPFYRGLRRHGEAGARRCAQALAEFDRLTISTIHGFCKRLLEEAAFESHTPFHVEFVEDEVPLLHAAAEDALRQHGFVDEPMRGAAVAVAEVTPTALVRDFRTWQHTPRVRLVDDGGDPEAAVAEIGQRLADCRDALDERALQILGTLRLKKDEQPKHPLGLDPTAMGKELRQRLQHQPATALAQCQAIPGLRKQVLSEYVTLLDHPFFAACDGVRAAHDRFVVAFRHQLLTTMARRLRGHKQTRAVLTFQDLLERTEAALRDPHRRKHLIDAVQQKWRIALIDEFQDTDPVQYRIFATCFRDAPLFLIGDPKQSIYAFRGADIESYLAARNDAVHRWSLTTNWRSNARLVAAVDRLFARPRPFVHTGIAMTRVAAACAAGEREVGNDAGGALRWRFVPAVGKSRQLPRIDAEAAIAADVATEVTRLLRSTVQIDDRALAASDIAVLTRTNAQALDVQAALRRAGVPSAIGKAGDIFEAEEIEEIETFLHAVLHCRQAGRLRAAAATRLYGLDAEGLARLHDDTLLESLIRQFEDWRRLWHRHGFVVLFEQLLADRAVRSRMLQRADGQRRLTNWLQIVELLHHAEHTHRLAPDALVTWLQRERAHRQEIDFRERELRLETDAEAVQILTVHGSKGLEYEVVFCPYLWDSRAAPTAGVVVAEPRPEADPDGIAPTHALAFDVDRNDPLWLRAETERLAEDLRLCYVALTRARRRCYVHWGPLGHQLRNAPRSALAWLLMGPTDLTDDRWPATWPESCNSQIGQWRSDLARFVAAADDLMQIDSATTAEPQAWSLPAAPARPAPRALPEPAKPWHVQSFTALVAELPTDDVPRDRDEIAAAPTTTATAPATGMFAFARGARAGQCLHAILEHVDLQRLDEPAARRLVTTTLQRHGLNDPAAHGGPLQPVDDVLAMLRELAATAIPRVAATFAQVCGGDRLPEWQFHLRTGVARVPALASVFAQHAAAPIAGYADRLRELTGRQVDALLTGCLDLVVAWHGRHWIIDWKSNHLGNDVADYAPAALQRDMFDHDYVLQYHLYALALHRHLRLRLHDYDFDRHFGGIVYVYLRGIRTGTDHGLFVDQPSAALIAALDRWAEGGS
ncbi:MAG: exodeoxyribonuclease V subunit beta [Planctomycetes bacterium]|nr:exodeoxyribonuclease V subunit beta [Planctomycetota bacterium]